MKGTACNEIDLVMYYIESHFVTLASDLLIVENLEIHAFSGA